MREKIPYLISRPGANGSRLWYWQPSAELRQAGWRAMRLDDGGARGRAVPAGVREAAIARTAEVAAWRAGGATAPRHGHGTLARLAHDWQASRLWANLRPNTRRGYLWALDFLLDRAGAAPFTAVSKRAVNRLYAELLDEGKTPRANAIMRTLQALYAFAVWDGQLPAAANPCLRMRLEGTAGGGRIWSAAAVAAIVAASDSDGRHSVGTAVLVNAWCGQRQADVLQWQRPDVTDGTMTITQAKTGAKVALPVGMVPDLAARIAAEIASQRARRLESPWLILSEETGRPYRADNFRHVFAAVRAKAAAAASAAGDAALAAELAGVDFMHLRHTAVTRLAEIGVELHAIAAITGHSLKSVQTIVRHYLVPTAALAAHAFRQRLAAEHTTPIG